MNLSSSSLELHHLLAIIMCMKTTYRLSDADLFLDEKTIHSKYDDDTAKQYILRIRDLPLEEKPREKMLSRGVESLTNIELLAIILTTGSKKEDVMNMSARILKDYGEQTIMNQKDPQKISVDLDVPVTKAMQIVAVGELGRRFFTKKSGGLAVIRTPKDVFAYCKDMGDLPKEHLRGIYLNAHHRVIYDEVISIGTVNSSVIHPREVFKPAIQYGAAAVILVHNHPSGVLKPSEADIEITRQLAEAGKIVGINLVDHVIVTRSGFISIEI